MYDSAGKTDPGTGVALDDVVLVFDDSGSLKNRILHGPGIDQVFASEDAMGEILWGLSDHQGSIRDVADYDAGSDSTSIANHLVYDAFGNITSETDPNVDFLYSYTGRIYDADAELYYYRGRWYDPVIGRFVSEDPIGFAAGDVNLSRYVGNGPTNATDPSGLDDLFIREQERVQMLLLGGPGKNCAACHPVQNTPLRRDLARDGAQNRAVATAATSAFFGTLWNSFRSVPDGSAGEALGDRWVAIAENQSGREFRGNPSEWRRFGFNGLVGDFSGVNPAVECVYARDLASENQLSGLDRFQRGAGALGTFSGNMAGGLGMTSRAPAAFPTATRLTNTTIGRSGSSFGRNTVGAAEVPSRYRSIYDDGTLVIDGQQPPHFRNQLPDPTATGAHSRIRYDTVNGRVYQLREFDDGGFPVRDIDFTNPTYPNSTARPGHPGPPHQHPFHINEPRVGPRSGFRRGGPEPMN